MTQEERQEILNTLAMVENELCFGGNWEDAKDRIVRYRSQLLKPQQPEQVCPGCSDRGRINYPINAGIPDYPCPPCQGKKPDPKIAKFQTHTKFDEEVKPDPDREKVAETLYGFDKITPDWMDRPLEWNEILPFLRETYREQADVIIALINPDEIKRQDECNQLCCDFIADEARKAGIKEVVDELLSEMNKIKKQIKDLG